MNKDLSFWERQHYYTEIDFSIIGAGLVGLTTAFFLKKKYPKAKIVIHERDFPALGASTKNAGFACFGSASEILSDLESMTQDEVVDLIRVRWEGLELLKEIVAPSEMDYKDYGAQEVFSNTDMDSFAHCSDQLNNLNDMVQESTGLRSTFSVKENLSFPGLYQHCIANRHEGQLNPMLMISRLSAIVRNLGVVILYNTTVLNILSSDKKIELKDIGPVPYKHLIVCTNGFAKSLLPEIQDLKTVRNQVIMTEEIAGLSLKGTFHMDQGYIYFRNYKNRILLGGARNMDLEGETTDQFGPNPRILAFLKDFLYGKLQVGKEVKISDQWSGILGVGGQKSPIVQELDRNIFVGIRMGGMGVAIGSAIGKKISTLIN